MPGNAWCSGTDTASITESPTAVMSLPVTFALVSPAVCVLAAPRLAVPAATEADPAADGVTDPARGGPPASALAPCSICRCRPLGGAAGLMQPAAQVATIALRARPFIVSCVLRLTATCVFDTIASPE